MNSFFLVLTAGMLTLTSGYVHGVETGGKESRSDDSGHRSEQAGAAGGSLKVLTPFVAEGASSGINIATAVAIGVVGAALISYGADDARGGGSPISYEVKNSGIASAGSDVRSTTTTTRAGTPTTIGIATTVSATSTTSASSGTTSASTVSSTGSM